MPDSTSLPSGNTGDDRRVHTCHGDCPCQRGGQAAPDFVESAGVLRKPMLLTDEQAEAWQAGRHAAIDALTSPVVVERVRRRLNAGFGSDTSTDTIKAVLHCATDGLA